MMDLQNISILDLLPQRPPFVMVDRLIYFDRIKTVTQFEVRSDCLFVDGSELIEVGLIENIAQTCAARMGYINLCNQETIKLGFIGAIRNLEIYGRPKIGDILTTSIEVKEEIFQMTLVNAIISSNGKILANAEMKIALSDMARAE